MIYNRYKPNYVIGTKAIMGHLKHTTGLTIDIDYREVVIVQGNEDYKNIVTYTAEGINGKSFKGISHWSHISTDKFDLVYKFVGNAVNWAMKHQDSLDYLIKANKKTKYFKEAFNLYIELNAEKFI
jgi:hypothetical protein